MCDKVTKNVYIRTCEERILAVVEVYLNVGENTLFGSRLEANVISNNYLVKNSQN